MTAIEKFLEALASKQPTPGGGSTAALNGALGAALVSMVCRTTLGKQKYASVEDEVRSTLDRTEILRKTLTGLIDEDIAAYNQVVAAYRLPKKTTNAQETRATAIQVALKQATLVPLETAAACADVMALGQFVATIGNSHASSDAAAGVFAAQAGLKASALNVLTNLKLIIDDEFSADQKGRLATILAETDQLAEAVYTFIAEA